MSATWVPGYLTGTRVMGIEAGTWVPGIRTGIPVPSIETGTRVPVLITNCYLISKKAILLSVMCFCRLESQLADVSIHSSVGMFTFHNVLHFFDAYTGWAKQFTLCTVMSNYHFVTNLYMEIFSYSLNKNRHNILHLLL